MGGVAALYFLGLVAVGIVGVRNMQAGIEVIGNGRELVAVVVAEALIANGGSNGSVFGDFGEAITDGVVRKADISGSLTGSLFGEVRASKSSQLFLKGIEVY
jgi:hypothetical protein